ncbi:MAG: Na(+)-translocating NADH-quinone reductase subunit C [Pirellulaceae bacterium]|nr:Na(+)-translocating NADH-quinone reductase subunit C [Pirellulaceae bacterium]
MQTEQRDSIKNTFVVSLVLCVVCSLLVSTAAVSLKDIQSKNKLLDRQRNIIEAAGLAEDVGALKPQQITQMFSDGTIEAKVVDLQSGEYVVDTTIANESFDERKAAKDEDMNTVIQTERFGIGIEKREKYTWVYLVKNKQGDLEQVVLPIYGKGLWSTLYGFVALKGDLKTINGLTYYEHGETPGLGGEVENPKWKKQWQGKQIWRGEPEDATLAVGVAKGSPTAENAAYMVDGLSGASITSRGVDNMIKYWFSSDAFGPYLKKLASQKGALDGNSKG